MKYYYLNSYDRKDFILSYKIENKDIVIKFANEEIKSIPYSEVNENMVISKMEEQVRSATLLKWTSPNDLLNAIAHPLLLPVAIHNCINFNNYFFDIILGIIAVNAVYYPAKLIKTVLDIKKLNYFLNNKSKLNEVVKLIDNTELEFDKEENKQQEMQKDKNKEIFNVNNIDNYSLSDLKRIKKAIDMIYSVYEDKQIISKDINKQKTKSK